MCDSLPATGHDAVTELDYLGDADDLLGVVALVRQQHQEQEDVGNDGLRIPGGKDVHFRYVSPEVLRVKHSLRDVPLVLQ